MHLVNKKEKGIALLLSLLISFIIAFALSVELLNIRLNEKTIASTRQYDQLFYTVEKKMQYWMNDERFYNGCLVFSSNPNDYPERLLQKNISSCSQNSEGISLNYVVEDLGLMFCSAQNKDKNAHFYRMSILGQNEQHRNFLLQVVYAVPEIGAVTSCQGQQSWRIVPI